MTRLRLLTAMLLLVALGLASAPAVQAAPYAVDFCRTSGNAPAPVLPGFAAFPDTLVAASCDAPAGSGGALAGTADPNGTLIEPGMFVAIPGDRPNLTIVGVQTSFSGALNAGATRLQTTAELNLRAHPSQAVLDNAPITAGTTTQQFVDAPTPAGTREIEWSTNILCAGTDAVPGPADCGPFTGCTTDILAAGECAPSVSVGATRLTLDEGVPPAAAAFGGTLLAGGRQSGRRTLTFDAGDADSGLAAVTVTIGSAVVGGVQYPCAFDDWSACPRDRPAQSLELDTTLASDGVQPVTVVARDAANNSVSIPVGAVLVANTAGGLAGLQATGGVAGPNGVNATPNATITARFAGTSQRTRRVRYTGSPTVQGRLLTDAGAPIGQAAVAVVERQSRAGAKRVQIATPKTAADGSYTFKVPPGPSRLLSFEYTANGGDATPAAKSTLRTLVNASLTVAPAPRSPRPGVRFTLSGRLRYLPRSGVEVKIQTRERDGKTWRTADDVKTKAGGTYTWTYRFRPDQGGRTFVFRTRVDSPIYPFEAGATGPLRVRVRR